MKTTKYVNRFNENENGNNNESENNEQNNNGAAQVENKSFMQKHGKSLLIGGTATAAVAAGIYYLYRVGKRALAKKENKKADDGFEEVDDKKKS